MIQVIVKKQNGNITGFHMEGHAGYADRGSDIVCASISVLAINCVNSIEEFTEDSFSEGMDEERGMISFDRRNFGENTVIVTVHAIGNRTYCRRIWKEVCSNY